jgi:hypothetical protein
MSRRTVAGRGPREQQRNLRNNREVTFEGRTQCISAWSAETGLSHSVISYRLRSGWPVEKVMRIPARLGNRIGSE